MVLSRSSLLLLASSVLYSLVHSQQCYFGADRPTDPRITPCSTTENGALAVCCLAGDSCLEGGACFNPKTYVTYLYGCTDSTYSNPACPPKWGFDLDASPWVAITKTNCSDAVPPVDNWTGVHPSSCGGKACPQGPWNSVEFAIPHVGCNGLEPRNVWTSKTKALTTWTTASPYIPPPTSTPAPEPTQEPQEPPPQPEPEPTQDPQPPPQPEPTQEPESTSEQASPTETSGWEISDGDGPAHSDPTSTPSPSFQTVTIETTESTTKPETSSSPANETPLTTEPLVCRTKTIAFATAIGVAGALLLIQALLFLCYIRRLKKKSSYIDDDYDKKKKFDEKSIGDDEEKKEMERVNHDETGTLTSMGPFARNLHSRTGFHNLEKRDSWRSNSVLEMIGNNMRGAVQRVGSTGGKAITERFKKKNQSKTGLYDPEGKPRIVTGSNRIPTPKYVPPEEAPPKHSPIIARDASGKFQQPPQPIKLSPQSNIGHELSYSNTPQGSREQLLNNARQVSGEQLTNKSYKHPARPPRSDTISQPSFQSRPTRSQLSAVSPLSNNPPRASEAPGQTGWKQMTGFENPF